MSLQVISNLLNIDASPSSSKLEMICPLCYGQLYARESWYTHVEISHMCICLSLSVYFQTINLNLLTSILVCTSVADPGFPVGGRAPVRGGVDLRCGHFSVKMYVKTKELGPIGGRAPGTPPLDPPMYMVLC